MYENIHVNSGLNLFARLTTKQLNMDMKGRWKTVCETQGSKARDGMLSASCFTHFISGQNIKLSRRSALLKQLFWDTSVKTY
jgi:hypothetical protein